ncbi:uncharacterized protein LOC119610909 [Lucilia sericata]|uniref:uncharacterized protein LOC119610909 n=1 Tax=Lucilia sericata TaxID=13632 RepID=UPI0018A7F40A|nr:uncharacterized protein LOC119610909 [Lucilia sericata]
MQLFNIFVLFLVLCGSFIPILCAQEPPTPEAATSTDDTTSSDVTTEKMITNSNVSSTTPKPTTTAKPKATPNRKKVKVTNLKYTAKRTIKRGGKKGNKF